MQQFFGVQRCFRLCPTAVLTAEGCGFRWPGGPSGAAAQAPVRWLHAHRLHELTLVFGCRLSAGAGRFVALGLLSPPVNSFKVSRWKSPLTAAPYGRPPRGHVFEAVTFTWSGACAPIPLLPHVRFAASAPRGWGRACRVSPAPQPPPGPCPGAAGSPQGPWVPFSPAALPVPPAPWRPWRRPVAMARSSDRVVVGGRRSCAGQISG